MADQFIGLHMVVTLKDPSGMQLKGTISDIAIADHAGDRGLVLSNVFVVGQHNRWFPRIVVPSENIFDLVEAKPDPGPSTIVATTATPPIPTVTAPAYSKPRQPALEDPAIVSVGSARPGSTSRPSSGLRAPTSAVEKPKTGAFGIAGLGIGSRDGTPELPGSMNGLDLDDSPTPIRVLPTGEDGGSQESQALKKKRRDRKNKVPKNAMQDAVDAQDSSPARPLPGNRGKGWRQTPILQSTSSFQPFNSLKRNGGKGKKSANDNGWASEDVTEGMGEFDFEGSLAKFDKRTLFDQMRKLDQIDDADRLVSHNRRPKPGTAGGKNLHYSENVLDTAASKSAPAADFWNSEADDGVNGEERLGGRDVRSSQSTRRADSRAAVTRRSQSRKASAATGAQPINRVNSGVRGQGAKDVPTYTILKRTDSMKQPTPQPGLYLLPSNRRLETVSALQMLNLENIAANEVGLAEDIMSENAGRGIAQVALTALTDPAIKVKMGTSGASDPVYNVAANATIAILAGNNKSGIRAIAAGRHLRSKGANVLVCLIGIERERDLLEDMRQQVRIYRNFGGRIFSKTEFFDYLRKNSTGSSPTNVTLIVDALLGLTISFEELRTGDQASVYELIEWANRNEAFVLAVDVPTGIDPTSGKVSIIDGSRLFIKPRYVVAMGAAKRGLLEAMSPQNDGNAGPGSGGDGGDSLADDDVWKLYIADIGLGSGVWKKAGTKLRRGIDFDDKWVLEMRYQGMDDGDDE